MQPATYFQAKRLEYKLKTVNISVIKLSLQPLGNNP